MAKKKRNFKKPVRIKVTHPGKLGGPGYLKKTASARHRLLAKCVSGYGYRSCLGSIQALEVWGKRSFSEKSKLRGDRAWLVRTYGAKPNKSCASIGPALKNASGGTATQPRRAFSGGFTTQQLKRNFFKLNEELL